MARDLIFRSGALLLMATSSLSFAQEPPLCESFTPGERCLCNDFGFTLKAEGLYWTSRENHLIAAISLAGLNSNDSIPPALDRWDFQGEMIRIEPGWDFGWRVELGYTSNCDYWDLFSNWTSFHTEDNQTLDLLQLPAWNPWGFPDLQEGLRLYDLSSGWKLKYDTLDFEFGRAFWIGRCLTFRPHFGVTASWIDQSFAIDFDYQPNEFRPFRSTLGLGCDFNGAGLNSGFTLHFTNGTGLGVYGKISISLLYGPFNSTLFQIEHIEAVDGEGTVIADTKDHFRMGVAAYQAILGVNWNRCFCCERFRFGLNAGWEFNQLNDINKFHHYSSFLYEGIYRQEHTSLMLMGLTFGASFDF